MQRIDGPTRSATLPAPAATGTGGSSPGYFADGDPTTSTPPTTVPADWFNLIQEELVAVVAAGGLTLDKATHTQVRDAIDAIIDAKIEAAIDQAELAPTFIPGATGYRISADGFIEQWGYEAGTISAEGTRSVAFPLAFPNACFGIMGTIVNPSANTTGSTQVQEISISTTGATVMIQNHQGGTIVDAGGGFRWSAKGY